MLCSGGCFVKWSWYTEIPILITRCQPPAFPPLWRILPSRPPTSWFYQTIGYRSALLCSRPTRLPAKIPYTGDHARTAWLFFLCRTGGLVSHLFSQNVVVLNYADFDNVRNRGSLQHYVCPHASFLADWSIANIILKAPHFCSWLFVEIGKFHPRLGYQTLNGRDANGA